MRRWWLILALASCTPPPGVELVETPATLARGEVSVTVGGGVGAAKETDNCCVGGGARVRLGIGGEQEVGASAHVIASNSDAEGSGQLEYKAARSKHLAVELGIGAAYYKGLDLGGDLAVLLATDREARRWQLYGGTRVTLSEPVGGDLDTLGPTAGLVVPLGVAIDLATGVQLFVEGGGLAGATGPGEWIGGYGALAVTLRP